MRGRERSVPSPWRACGIAILVGASPRRPSSACPSTSGSWPSSCAAASRPSPRSSWPPWPGSTRPRCARTCPSSARSAPGGPATTRLPALPDRPGPRRGRELAGGRGRDRQPGPGPGQLRGFASRGFQVAALFDVDPAVVGQEVQGMRVRHMDEISGLPAASGRPSASWPPRAGRPRRWPTAGRHRRDARSSTSPHGAHRAPHVLLRYVDLSIELQVLASTSPGSDGAGAGEAARRGPGCPSCRSVWACRPRRRWTGSDRRSTGCFQALDLGDWHRRGPATGMLGTADRGGIPRCPSSS